VNSNDN